MMMDDDDDDDHDDDDDDDDAAADDYEDDDYEDADAGECFLLHLGLDLIWTRRSKALVATEADGAAAIAVPSSAPDRGAEEGTAMPRPRPRRGT